MGLMTLSDLAERWGLAESKVKDLVREDSSIPFVRLGKGGDLRINWDRVRFRLEAIERWEEEHQTVFGEAKPVIRLEGPWNVARAIGRDWVVKLKGPAQTPPKPRPLPVRVDNPQRVRSGRQSRKTPGIFVDGWAWGSPFRVREVEGRWSVIWTGDEMGLAEFKLDGWEDIPCESRREAADLALEAFRDWLTSKSSTGLLNHTRHVLRGYNLVCPCPLDYPCHGSVLIELVNRVENKP